MSMFRTAIKVHGENSKSLPAKRQSSKLDSFVGIAKQQQQQQPQPQLRYPNIPRTAATPRLRKSSVGESVLKPVSSSVYNTPIKPLAQLRGLKRKSSALERTLDSHDSFEESVVFSPEPPMPPQSSLHDAVVYYDENDFSDDEHIQQEIRDPILRDALPVNQNADGPLSPPTTATTPKQSPRVNVQPSPSAQLADWLSSPTLDTNSSQLVKSRHAEAIDERFEPELQPRKRRGWPWSKSPHSTPDPQVPYPDLSHHQNSSNSSGAISSQVTPPNSGKPATHPQTPVRTDKGDYLWNQTASAVKEGQKKLRESRQKQREGGAAKVNQNDLLTVQKVSRIELSEEQKEVLEMVLDKKKSVFFTGPAGTGKSVLMRELITQLRRKYRKTPESVAVTASTGLAACNIGGVTLHSFAGIGLGKDEVALLVKKIRRNPKAKTRWLRVKVLIIDEVSMVDGDLFDKLEGIARQLRNNGKPFGGIQLVVTGDFFQLPPVAVQGRAAKFSFDAQTWDATINETYGLKQVFRQKDPAFAAMLNEMRLGKMSRASIEEFKSLSRPIVANDSIEATELFSTRQEVERANNQRLQRLSDESIQFIAIDTGSNIDIKIRDKILSNCMAPQEITLKKGAQVMLIKNIDDTLVNGSLGRVVSFMNERTFEYYLEGEETAEMAELADGNDGESMHAKVRKKLGKMLCDDYSASDANVWPVVRFQIADGSTRDFLCQRETWEVELPNGEVQASRSQVPLILAWAISIHKAQGQTLERVKVDLRRIFEKGQAYVALSRATSKAGLQVLGFDPKKVMAHEKVRKFYNSLYAAKAVTDEKPKGTLTDYFPQYPDTYDTEDEKAFGG